MKKIISIALLLLGIVIFLFCGYGFAAFMTTNKEKFVAKYAAKGQDANTFYKEGIDNHIQHGRVVTGLMTFIGLSFALCGYGLYRKSASVQ